MTFKKHILVVDDEINMRHMLGELLKQEYMVSAAADGSVALEMVRATHETDHSFDVVLCDIAMPVMDGLAFIREAKDFLEDTTVIMMSAYGSVETALEAMKAGAYDYISKPFKSDEIFLTLKKAEERERLKQENQSLKQELTEIKEAYTFGHMVGKSDAISAVFKSAEKASNFDVTVLITGESGTGKELVARGIHASSHRAGQPWVTVNCGALPEQLVESELFGYAKGAFTGAYQDKKGLFEQAHTGTLFLDEIGELSLDIQVKLLRVLQEKEVRRVGGSRTIPVDVRIIAATSKNLKKRSLSGEFREDLFFRLHVFPISLPPLRERKSDIPLLASHFNQVLSRRMKLPPRQITGADISLLSRYDWPGNVRELENILERALMMTDDGQLHVENIPELQAVSGGVNDASNPEIPGLSDTDFSIKKAHQIIEAFLIRKALKHTGGNRTQAGKLLEISHPSLLSKIKSYGIDDC